MLISHFKHNVPTNHQYPDQNGMISFQGPNFMDYSHGFQPRYKLEISSRVTNRKTEMYKIAYNLRRN